MLIVELSQFFDFFFPIYSLNRYILKMILIVTILFFLAVLVFEFRVSHLLCRSSTTLATPPALFVLVIFLPLTLLLLSVSFHFIFKLFFALVLSLSLILFFNIFGSGWF
jgi:hypothetical protein